MSMKSRQRIKQVDFFFPNAVYKLCPKEDTTRMIVLSQAPQRSKDIGECKLTLVHKWILGIRLET